MMTNSPQTLPEAYFTRRDDQDDAVFYSFPRKVVHIDDGAIATLTDFLAELLPAGGTYLDLMSSWRSHLPSSLTPKRVVGLGMNGEEMADNPQLDEHHVHNLNQNQTLPFDDETFDAAICTVSVQYLMKPLAVFAEVHRVLKPQAPFIVSFSNRCFPQKAVAVWVNTTDQQHVDLVAYYFQNSAAWGEVQARQKEAAFLGSLLGSDPLYIVWACKADFDTPSKIA